MSHDHDIRIRSLQPSDLDFAQEVRKIAGWNQTDADWLRLINYEPDGCFLIECDGGPAGTATTTTYGNKVGWIGMVLVYPDFRRRGLATILLQHCISYLETRVSCIRLDATPAGREVYQKLGFVDEYRLHRWQRGDGAPENPTIAASLFDGEKAKTLDTEAFGADRSQFLSKLRETATLTIQTDDGSFGFLRSGKNAWYLGPVVSSSNESGVEIIEKLLANCRDEAIYWDILEPCKDVRVLAEKLGFTKQRELIRMRRGEALPSERPERQWAIGAPETG